MKVTAMIKLLVITTILFATPCMAQDGYDYDKGNFIEIEGGNLVRRGRTIEIYDYDNGQYKDVEVESIQRVPGAVEVEVYDPQTGEYRTFEMDER